MTTSAAPGSAPSAALRELARACGVATEYYSWSGSLNQCSAAAMVAALGAMGIDARSEAAIERAWEDLEDYVWRRPVPAVTVVRQGQSREIPIHVYDGDAVSVEVILETGERFALEQLDRYVPPRDLDGVIVGRATFLIPDSLPLGWHQVEAHSRGASRRGYVVVTPQRVEIAQDLYTRKAWGLMGQLYSIRSSRSWGLGDFTDLADLSALAAFKAGADFVLINPLHASEPVPPIEPSPYLPISRQFLSPLYIRVESIPEVAYLPSQDRAVLEWESERPRRRNATTDYLDREMVWQAKEDVLHRIFEVPRSAGREAKFEAFCIHEGKSLEDFATWCALAVAFDGQEWPEEFRDVNSDAVAQWRNEHVNEVLFQAWLQWICDEQLGQAQATAKKAGMRIGVMTDLAVGVHPEGADAWALKDVLAQGVTVGAPPDMYNQLGQNWSQPPWQPRALEAAAYLPFRQVVRKALRNAGALRVDHVLGLFRQWWVPEGHDANDGTYVQFDHEALVGILALEAQRAGAVIIGEDLGTVEPWVSDYLNERGILGTVVSWFERSGVSLKPFEQYRSDALASITTHDLPPSAAYLAGAHVDIREELGLLVEDADKVRADARAERRNMEQLLQERGYLGEEFTDEELITAMHRAVKHAPPLLFAVAITDLVGEQQSQNLPGTFKEYPNWRIPLADNHGQPVLLDDLFDHARVQRMLKGLSG